MAGGVKQGELNPTWLKQPGDMAVAGFATVLCTVGMIQWAVVYYRLSYGTGKLE
jgi:hypothetical protein